MPLLPSNAKLLSPLTSPGHGLRASALCRAQDTAWPLPGAVAMMAIDGG